MPRSGRLSVGGSVVRTLVGRTFAPAAALATAPIMAHALGVDGRGEVAAATAPLFLATAVATFGMPAVVTNSTASRAVRLAPLVARAGTVLGAVGLLATVAVFVASGWSSGADPELGALTRLVAVATVPTLAVTLLQAVAAGRHRWDLVLRERSITAGTRLAGFAALAASGALDVRVAALLLAITPVLGGAAYVGLLRRVPRDGLVPDDDPPRLRAMLSYGGRVWLGSVSGILLSRVDQVLLTPLLGVDALGLYVVAVTVSELPRVISDAARDVLFSTDAAAPSNDRLARVARLSAAAVVTVSLAIALAAPVVVPVAFGSGFAAATVPLLVLLGASVVGSATSVAAAGLVARGRPGARSLAFAVSCAANVALLLVLAPAWGVLGAALATLGASIVLAAVNGVLVSRLLGVRSRYLLGIRRSDLAAVQRFVRSRSTSRSTATAGVAR